MKSSRAAYAAFGALCVLLVVALIGLGTWQVQRRAWKLDLIERVDARIHAAPSAAPFGKPIHKDDEYRRVRITGQYLAGKDTLVQAATERGAGWWVISPFATNRGIVLINRGYVANRSAPPAPTGQVSIVGLLRLTEPGGGFLRSNDPSANRWFSRDVVEIARSHSIATEPYFIDAEADVEQPGQPIAGLTVVKFANNHLIYAITWYTLAVMTAAAYIFWMRSLRQSRRRT